MSKQAINGMNKAGAAPKPQNNKDYHKSRLFMIRFMHLARQGNTTKEMCSILKLSRDSVVYWAEKFGVELAKAQIGRIPNKIRDNYEDDDFRYNDEIIVN